LGSKGYGGNIKIVGPRGERSWLAVLALLALLAGACGSGAEGSGGSEGQEAASPAAQPEARTAPATGQPDSPTQAAPSCYEGETAAFVVAYGAGGGYDQIARLLAPYLEDELGATVVVENRPGAGGLLAANNLFAAEPDGLEFGFFSGQGIAGSVLGGAEGVNFELPEFSSVARVAADPRVLIVGAQTPYQTIEDVQAAEGLLFASAGPGGSDHIDATVLFPLLDIDGRIITGYEGGAETELAVTSGDAQLASGTVATAMTPIEAGDHRAVLIIGDDRVEELPDVPAMLELDLDEDQRALAEAHIQLQDMGRLVWAPPGVPADCLAQLRGAFEAALGNPELLAEIEGAGLAVDHLSGEELRAVTESVLAAPPEYVSLLQQAFRAQ